MNLSSVADLLRLGGPSWILVHRCFFRHAGREAERSGAGRPADERIVSGPGGRQPRLLCGRSLVW